MEWGMEDQCLCFSSNRTMLWIYGQISSEGIYMSKWRPEHPRVRFKCPAKILHLKTKIPCKLDWLEETFVLKHQSDQLQSKMPNALANAHIIQDLRRHIYGLNKGRLCMTDQQALSLSNHQGSLLIHSAEKTVGKVLFIIITRNWLRLRKPSNP